MKNAKNQSVEHREKQKSGGYVPDYFRQATSRWIFDFQNERS